MTGPAVQVERRALIVSDKDTIRTDLGKNFEKLEIEYDTASSTKAGLETLDAGEHEYSAVLMSGLNGGWRDIFKMARERGIPAVFFGKSSLIVRKAASEGVPAYPRNILRNSKGRHLKAFEAIVKQELPHLLQKPQNS